MCVNGDLCLFMRGFASVSAPFLSRCGSRLGVTEILIASRLMRNGVQADLEVPLSRQRHSSQLIRPTPNNFL